MTVADGTILRGVATFDIASQSKAQNVYHFLASKGSSQSDVEVVTAITECIENLMDQLASAIVTSVTLDGVEVYERLAGSWLPIGVQTSSWAGTNAGDRPPAGEALMIELYKERTGYKDRKYIAGLSEAQSSGDTFGSGTLAQADDYVDEILLEFTGSTGGEVTPVHYNRDTGETKAYTGGRGNPTVSYQRRRKPGVGLT